MSEKVVEAGGLTKVFGGLRAVDGIDFAVARGETFGLLGPNGAGKSTTMRMIACRTPLTTGSLFVEGYDVRTHARAIRSLIGVVPQDNNLDPDLNVRQNLLTYARFYRIPKFEAESRTNELLRLIGLEERAGARIEELSGGMKRRLMIVRALLHSPRLLVLDEPTTGLDPHVRQEIWQRLDEFRRQLNVTIIISTHYMEEAEKLCERLLVIDKGRILARGTPLELIRARVPPYVLEVRDVDSRKLFSVPSGITALERGGAHLYFAPSAEALSPLLKAYEGQRLVVRPSNLEDVFLQLLETENEVTAD